MLKVFLSAMLLCGAAFGQTASYTVSLRGSQTVYAGFDTFIELRATFSETASHLFFNEIRVPEGVSWEIYCSSGDESCWKHSSTNRVYNWGGVAPVLFRFITTAAARVGNHEIEIVTEAGGVIQRVPIILTVLAPPADPIPNAPASVIPGLAKWESTMLALAARWCNPSEVQMFGWEGQVWYYDGARVFFQVADYTGDKKWEACAFNIASQYADYAINAGGWVPGWRVFPHGLRMAYERSRDEKYRQALLLLANASAFARRGGSIDETFIRETAFAAQAYIEAEKVGAPRHPRLGRAIGFLLGHFRVLFETKNYSIHQLFYDGLAAEALIQYYELTRDPRIPPAIEKMLTWVWHNAWNHTTKKLLINPEPEGPKCSWGCQQYNTELINLVAPTFAWYWRHTRDPKYQLQGDELFAHSLDTDISYNGRIFSQNYRWSFDYVRWRGGR